MNKLFKCLATIEENLNLSFSKRFLCSVTALSLSRPGASGAFIAFKSAEPATLKSSLPPGSSASFNIC